ncbi:MAG: cation:proton antiporter [Acidobacteria bacterium]|nr:cation:proton antiporter [Acidobacteriota bacterium]
MSASEFGALALPLLALLATAHLLGALFVRLRQPRVAGEILAGVVLGGALLGAFAPALSARIFPAAAGSALGLKHQSVIGFLYNLGLLLLMFASGAESNGLFRREDRREVAWLTGLGAGLPFAIALALAPALPLDRFMGEAGQRLPLLLVLGIAVAVTSIPVISKIFHDLGILHTRFARLVLGVAVVEDIVLWAVLAVATAMAGAGALAPGVVATHVFSAIGFFAAGLALGPPAVQRITAARWNVLARQSPVAYAMVVLLAFTAAAAALDVSLVFAAFLAGYALIRERDLREAIATISKVAFAVFIPLYFAVVGYQLELTRAFSFRMLLVFMAAACAVKLVSAGLGARLARFSWQDSANLAIVLNARGGPGIVLASVAFDARIINASFYTTLVLVAVLTSQAAGAWLDHLLRAGRPLLDPGGAAGPDRRPADAISRAPSG